MSDEEKQDEQFVKYPYIADAEIGEKSLKDVLKLPDGIEVRKSPLAGYGVFATRDIEEGETLEGKARHEIKCSCGEYMELANPKSGAPSFRSNRWGQVY